MMHSVHSKRGKARKHRYMRVSPFLMKSKYKPRWVLFRINNVHGVSTNSVILQVVWNSKNDQIIGLAMTSDQLSSLHDVFREIGEGFRTNNTSYVLQFMWRDLSSKFDVIGPHFLHC